MENLNIWTLNRHFSYKNDVLDPYLAPFSHQIEAKQLLNAFALRN